MFTSEKSRFGSFYLLNTTILAFSSFFKKHYFELKILLGVRFWIEKKHNASDLELNKKRQILKTKKTTRQILKKNLFV